jgi:Aldo/keto reductase family/Zinc-binding dehydrogenase
VTGRIVLVHGVRGSVSSLAAQLVRWGGATVIGTVRTEAEVAQVDKGVADNVIALQSDPAATATAIRELAPDGVDRVVEVALSVNADLDAAVVRNGAVVAAYASTQERPELPFWPLLFANVTIRLLGSDDFPQAAKDTAARDLTAAAAQGASASGIVEAQWAAEQHGLERFSTEQPPYSILSRGIEREILPATQRFGMGTLVWGPLGQGMLTGRVRRNQQCDLRRAGLFQHLNDESRLDAVEQFVPLAEEAGLPMTHLSRDGVTTARSEPEEM